MLYSAARRQVSARPLLCSTGNKSKIGEFVNPLWIKLLGWTTASMIVGLNAKLLFDVVAG